MAYRTACPFCKKEFHIFNVQDRDFNCPVCRKKISQKQIKKEKAPSQECVCCGKCCQFVPELSCSDVKRLQKNIGKIEDFVYRKKGKTYLYVIDAKNRKRECTTRQKGYYCIFMDRETFRCTIHSFKPAQCRKLEASFSCQGLLDPEVDFSRI